MPAGRPPKPTELHVLEGTFRKDRERKNRPEPTKGAPNAPTWLSREAKAEWRRIVPELDDLGLLTKVDRAALALYCDAWAIYHEASKDVWERGQNLVGPKGERRNPSLLTMKEARAAILKFASRYGLTASDRMRLEAPKKSEPEQSPMEKFLSRAKTGLPA